MCVLLKFITTDIVNVIFVRSEFCFYIPQLHIHVHTPFMAIKKLYFNDVHLYCFFFHADGLLEDLSHTASDKSTRSIGKLKEWKQISSLNINPSYGVLPGLLENAEERKGSTIKDVIYVNALRRLPENAKETKRGTIKDDVYVNDQQRLPENAEEAKRGTTKDVIYANDPKPVVEEYEYVNIPPRSTEQSHTPTKQLLAQNQFDSSAEYAIPCT